MSSVQSVDRAFAILRALSGGPLSVTDLAARVDLPKSTVSRLLSTLVGLDAVETDQSTSTYRVGPAVVAIAEGGRSGQHLAAIARPHLVELSEALGETAGLSILDGDLVLYLDDVAPDSDIQVRNWTGERLEPHAVSSGLVLMAFASAADRERLVRGPHTRFTDATMTSSVDLRSRLDHIGQTGWVWVTGEFSPDINSVAAPVTDASGVVVAAVHAHGPAYRFPEPDRADEIAAVVITAAERISGQLSAHDPIRSRSGDDRRPKGTP